MVGELEAVGLVLGLFVEDVVLGAHTAQVRAVALEFARADTPLEPEPRGLVVGAHGEDNSSESMKGSLVSGFAVDPLEGE